MCHNLCIADFGIGVFRMHMKSFPFCFLYYRISYGNRRLMPRRCTVTSRSCTTLFTVICWYCNVYWNYTRSAASNWYTRTVLWKVMSNGKHRKHECNCYVLTTGYTCIFLKWEKRKWFYKGKALDIVTHTNICVSFSPLNCPFSSSYIEWTSEGGTSWTCYYIVM